MNENELIKYDSEDELYRNNVRVERSKRKRSKRKRGLLKILFTFLIIGIVIYGGYKSYPYFQELLTKMESENTGNTDTPPTENENEGGNTGESDDNPNSAPPTDDNTIPNGHFPIIENQSSYLFSNESQYEFSPIPDFSPIKASEVYAKYGNDAPLVLITHFSSLESYSNGKSYSYDDSFYSELHNIGSIGGLLCSYLNELGINTIHLNEVYASGSIYNSKPEYEKSVEAMLKQFPSITYVFNLSRDVSINKDMSMIKSVLAHNEVKLAQLSFISGSFDNSMSENQAKNASFALSLSSFVNSSIDSFVKKNTISSFPLSQNYNPYFLEIEFGTYANSYNEVKDSSLYFAELLSKYLA